MKELSVEIQSVIELINMFAEVLVGGVRISNDEMIQVLSNSLLQVLPNIVEMYESEEPQNYKEEIEFWQNQFERLLQALQGNDRFFLYDVLVNETRTALTDIKIKIVD